MSKSIIQADQVSGDIVVLMPSFLGDAINATPALGLLRELYPDRRIHVLCRPAIAPVFARRTELNLITHVDQRYAKDKISLFAMATQIRKLNPGLAILFRNSFADALLMRLAGINFRVGYTTNGRGFLLSQGYKINRNRHYICRYAHLVNVSHGEPFSSVGPTSIATGEESVLGDVNKLKIGIYVGGKNKTFRCYPHDMTAEMIIAIADKMDCQFYLLGNGQEAACNQHLIDKLNNQNVNIINLAGKTSMLQLVDSINQLDVLLTIDSGPLHVAAACATPYVAIVGFGTSPWSIVEPKNGEGIALVANGDWLCDKDIIRAIKPSQVVDAVQQLLG